eukprot:15456939-Alexandrium_andersonii.AAC.1
MAVGSRSWIVQRAADATVQVQSFRNTASRGALAGKLNQAMMLQPGPLACRWPLERRSLDSYCTS